MWGNPLRLQLVNFARFGGRTTYDHDANTMHKMHLTAKRNKITIVYIENVQEKG